MSNLNIHHWMGMSWADTQAAIRQEACKNYQEHGVPQPLIDRLERAHRLMIERNNLEPIFSQLIREFRVIRLQTEVDHKLGKSNDSIGVDGLLCLREKRNWIVSILSHETKGDA